MLDNHGFDLWAGTYDSSVQKSEESKQYPFAGYSALMNAIYGTIMERSPAKVLDIGFGTAVLSSKLYQAGNDLTGIDFSTEMIQIARQKMPGSKLIQWDFTQGIPDALKDQRFDFIISTYALHHLPDQSKAPFIIDLLKLVNSRGMILIGDVGFRTREELLACQEACGESWDEEEAYFVFSELEDELGSRCRLSFHEFSFCSGIIEIHLFE